MLLGVLATVSLDEADHHVGAATAAPVGLLEHGEGLAHARRGPKVDPKLSMCHRQILPLLRCAGLRGRSAPGELPVQSEVELEDVDAGFP